MADITITELPADALLTGTEEVPVMDGGVTKKTTAQAIANLAAGGVTSVNGKVGVVVLNAADVGADVVGTAVSVVASHVSAPDPHTQYALESNLGSAAYAATTDFASALGTDDNYVTDAEKAKIGNLPTDTISSLAGKENLSAKGQALGYCPLDSSAKVAEAYLPDSVLGQVEYQGVWNATTNTPTIPTASTTNKGWYYIVSVSGTTTVDGISEWIIGDWIISNGTTWNKVDNTDSVSSVFGRSGAIVANSGDYTASQIANTPSGNIAATTVQAAIEELDSEKQATLVSGTNIKTINGSSVLGSGDLVVSSGHTIQEEGVSLTARTKLNFVGTAVTVTDDAGNDASVVTITSSGVSDGDKGNITVSNGGATWTVNDGDITNAKLAFDGGALSGFRNVIINGNFNINQRGYVSGATTTAGQYTFDRWKVTGTGGITFSTTSNKTTVTIPSSQTLKQVIEGLNLRTGTYVLSWEGTAQGKLGAGAYGASGAVTSTITGGTNTTIEFGPGTLANVQLELGTVATPLENRPIGLELALCQRYYVAVPLEHYAGCIAGYAPNSYLTAVKFPVVMRSIPTISVFDRLGNSGVGLYKAATEYLAIPITLITIDTNAFFGYTTTGVADAGLFIFAYTASAEL